MRGEQGIESNKKISDKRGREGAESEVFAMKELRTSGGFNTAVFGSNAKVLMPGSTVVGKQVEEPSAAGEKEPTSLAGLFMAANVIDSCGPLQDASRPLAQAPSSNSGGEVAASASSSGPSAAAPLPLPAPDVVVAMREGLSEDMRNFCFKLSLQGDRRLSALFSKRNLSSTTSK